MIERQKTDKYMHLIITHSSLKFANPLKPLQSDSKPNINVCYIANFVFHSKGRMRENDVYFICAIAMYG